MSRKTTSKVEQLGVKDLVDQLLEANATYQEIADAVQKTTGMRLSDSALSRYRHRWSSAKASIEETSHQVKVLTEALKANPDLNFEDAGMAILLNKLVEELASAKKTFQGASLLQLGHLLLKAHRTKQSAGQLDVQRERLELLKERVHTAAEKVEEVGKAKGLDPETLKKIREEIYGIAPVAA